MENLNDDSFWDNHLHVALAAFAVGSLLFFAVLKGMPHIYNRLLGSQEVDVNTSKSVVSLNWVDMNPTVHLDWQDMFQHSGQQDLENELQQRAQEPDDSQADFFI